MPIANYLLPLLLLFFSCNPEPPETKTHAPFVYKVHTYKYAAASIPEFLKELVNNHKKDFAQLSEEPYLALCEAEELDPKDPRNFDHFYTIKILHDLFTSKSATDCGQGEILDIPYFWHWIAGNPRYEIYFKASNTLLKETKPPGEFSKYQSYADIDRTPALYLTDLFQEEPKYYHNSCGAFNTFGWCSEREMAYICLMNLLGYTGKVAAEGVHSWSELIVPMYPVNGVQKNMLIRVDNTFDHIRWSAISDKEIEDWKQQMGNSNTEKWYNEKALSKTEQQKVLGYPVSNQTINNFETAVVNYLKRNIQ